MARRLAQWYIKQTQARPWTTAITTGTCIVSASDITAQNLEGNEFDYRRLAALAMYGGVYSGAAHKVLYAGLERAVPIAWSKTSRTLSQIGLSQFIHTPLIQLPVFYAWTGTARGYDSAKIKKLLRDTYETTLFRNYLFWLPTTGLMYALVPLHLRVLVMNSASYFWNTGLSLMTQSNDEDEIETRVTVEFGAIEEMQQVSMNRPGLVARADEPTLDSRLRAVMHVPAGAGTTLDVSTDSPWPLL